MSAGPESILVVDDEAGIREGCRKVLTAEGYSVEVAPDGGLGLAAFGKGGRFAAVLVDLRMPDMDGLEVINRLRELDGDVVLLIITAYASIQSAVDATKQGAYAYVPKPFTPDELLLPLRNGLERRRLALEARRLRQEREERMLELEFERSKGRTIINCMSDGVLVANRDLQLVMLNPAALRMLPECADVRLPAPLESTLAAASEELASLVRQVFDRPGGATISSGEVTLGPLTYMVNASPVLDSGGRAVGAVGIMRDITPLKSAMLARSTFAAMVAHEVRRPLGVIESYLESVLTGAMDDDEQRRRHALERSLLRARSLREMTSELMDLTAMDAGEFNIQRRPVRMCDVLGQAVAACEKDARAKGILLSLECDAPGREKPALADPEAMLVVATNLIDNAVKYSPAGTRVDVRLACGESTATFSVADQGMGIAPGDADRIFDDFVRITSRQTAEIPGTGLGLSIVKRLVEAHHGRVTLRSTPGEGSEFAVTIPLAEAVGRTAGQ